MQKVLLRKHDKLDFRANEAFKTLRTNILFSGHDTRVITLTSSTPNEGKSSLSFQLAVSFSTLTFVNPCLWAVIRRRAISSA